MTVTARPQARPLVSVVRMLGPSHHVGLMIALTFVTGIVDAGGYLGLDKVFVGNMTGNVVILGMGAAGSDGLPVLGPALALVAFISGAGAAGVTLRSARSGWGGRVTAVAVASTILVAVTAVTTGVLPDTSASQVSAAVMTACAMGAQAAAARKVGVADVTTVVVTSTITVWAIDAFARPGFATILNRRVIAIIAILLGALTGALLLQVALWMVFAAAAGISAVVVAIGHLGSQHEMGVSD
ncbi:DUF1275 domain-containing protein [Gordonia sp. HY002]|uniref:DUF1275 family protein n=1 Tax=Gordonia zhenghanii TaxID=2911516 RepID=UPI001EF02DB5|nr:YoaK family protein [Gordonia zhenghanii]MCF8570982.1 DUF1275 domain-containing protein [Gordonia zhenghanii]MCF8604725.1 DUF1275 domain-containing protein [Gordonia zhenghanii]